MADNDNLKLSTAEFQAAISRFESEHISMENSYLKISNAVRELDTTWNDPQSEQFKAKFNELYNNLKQCGTVMNNIVSKLKEAQNIVTGNEDQIAQMYNSADEGTSYVSMM